MACPWPNLPRGLAWRQRRHADLIRQCREAGARIRLISDGDVAGAIEVAKAGAPVDIMMGIGGTPEGVIAGARVALQRRMRTQHACGRACMCHAVAVVVVYRMVVVYRHDALRHAC